MEIFEDRTLLTAFFVDNNADSGAGSLRQAILDANGDSTDPVDTIEFRSGASAIVLSTPLASITGPVVVNVTGRTDVTIDGGGTLDGFTLAAGSDGSTIQDLTIRNFAGAAIRILSDDNQILGNTLGGASATVGHGVLVEGGSDNTVGTSGSGNTIGFATIAGVAVSGSTATGNLIRSNLIGAGQGAPIGVLVDGAPGNTIGGTAAGAANVIGSSSVAGVRLLGSGATGNLVQGNLIGVGSGGESIGNAHGVQIFDAPGNTIGGAAAGNLIGNSAVAGVLIAGSDSTGNVVAANTFGTTVANAAAPNAYGVQINNAPNNSIGGTTGLGNAIDASTAVGVQIFGPDSTGNTVVGNAIGRKGTTGPLQNGIGVQISGAGGNTIGGTAAGSANVVVLASTAGVQIVGPTPAGNAVIGNFIGTDATLAAGLGNPFGVQIFNSDDNTVGGSLAGQANTVGFNALAGVGVLAGTRNFVLRNLYVGSNGSLPQPNPAGDINVGAAANGGILPPVIATASLEGANLRIRFTADLAAGTTVEVYTLDATAPGRRTFFAAGQIQAGTPNELLVPSGSLTDAAVLLVTASRPTFGTSAFSNTASVGDLLTVTTNVGVEAGSLPWVIANLNAGLGGEIRFQLDPGERTILVAAGSPLPALTSPATMTVPAGVRITIQATGPATIFDGLVLAPGSDGSVVQDLDFVGFGGAGLRVQSDGVTIRRGRFDGGGVGLLLEGAGNTVEDATFVRSSIAGVQISGLGATGNIVRDSFIGTDAASTPGLQNAVGVVILGASGNTIGQPGRSNVIADNAQQGVSLLAGDRNVIQENAYRANGPEVGGVYGLANSLFVAPGSNQGILPAHLLSASQGLAALSLLLQLDTTFASNPEIEVYRITATTAEFLGRGSAGFASGSGVATLPIAGVLPGDRLAVTITGDVLEGSINDPGDSTSAFSNQVLVVTPNVVVNTNDSGDGSLRGAVNYVSTLPADADRSIIFRIPDELRDPAGNWVIYLATDILIPSQVYIDGWNTQPSSEPLPGQFISPSVWLAPRPLNDPENNPDNTQAARGLVFQAGSDGSLVRGLGFREFVTAAVEIQTSNVQVVGNLIFGSFLPDGTPQGFGVSITGGTGNLIGGSAPGLMNVVGRFETAIRIAGPGSNYILSNQIGTNGFTSYRNIDGVSIVDSPNNLIRDNLIGNSTSGSAAVEDYGAGVRITGLGSVGNRVAGNSIGVLPFRDLEASAGNDVGIYVDASGNTIGSLRNGEQGIAGTQNVIGRNIVGVILTSTATGNVLAGNFVGTDPSGRALGNTQDGIWLRGARSNFVGQPAATLVNVIGWNAGAGIRLDSGASDNLIGNNVIGSSLQGAPLPNGRGIVLGDASRNILGPLAGAGPSPWDPTNRALLAGANFISGNVVGVVFQAGSRDNQLRGNVVGAYLAFPGNQGDGIRMEAGASNWIGGGLAGQAPPAALTPGVANVITGNLNGVHVGESTSDALIAGNWIYANRLNGVRAVGDMGGGVQLASILGNYIGTTFDGASNRTSDGAPTGNGLSGVLLNPTGSVPTGAAWSVDVRANLISSNGLNGVGVDSLLVGEVSTFNGSDPTRYARVLVAENVIGLNLAGQAVDARGVPLGNGLDGVRIINVGGVQVGSYATGDRPWSNVISGNLGRGVEVFWPEGTAPATATFGVWIVKNVIGGDLMGRAPQDAETGTGNLADGVFVFGDARASILSNRIVGNRGSGVHATDSLGLGGFGGSLLIESNEIGTDREGEDYNNSGDGVFLDRLLRGEGSTGGEVALIRRNAIGANRGNGITVQDSVDVGIKGNLIGSIGGIAGNAAQDHGNLGNGVFLNRGSRVTIGGAAAGDGNIVSGNQATGVILSGGGAHVVLGNLIGVGADGASSVGNLNSGIIVSASNGNVIGVDPSGRGVGNVISGNRLYGVLIAGGRTGSDLNTVAGNRIGTDLRGGAAVANFADGLFLLDASNTTIGGASEASRNVISGNRAQGIRIFGAGAVGNVLVGNFIGVGADGTTRIGNQGNGVIVENAGPNRIGVGGPLGGNVISGNAQSGVVIASTVGLSSDSQVLGNLIGLDASGETPVGNGGAGVVVSGAAGVQVGGTGAGQRNWISGNGQSGVLVSGAPIQGAPPTIYGNTIGLNRAGDRAIGNGGSGVQIVAASGVEVGYNVISANAVDGVQIFSPVAVAPADRNRIVGNFIGTNAAGTGALGNRGVGVDVINGHGNVIGGATRNVVSGNGAHGVVVEFQANRGFEGAGNVVDGNYIGLDRSGSRRVANGLFGVLLNNAVDTVVGYATGSPGLATIPGTLVPAPGQASNVISGNGAAGVVLTGSTTGTRVRGSFLGVDAQGRAFNDVGAGLDLYSRVGVLIESRASNNWIGGLVDGEGGVLEGTGNILTQSAAGDVPNLLGVQVNSPEALGNRIQSNLIGLDAQGRSGSNSIGVLLANAQDVRVGGYLPRQAGIGPNSPLGNVITGNALAGVEMIGSLATRNVLVNNFIGTGVSGLDRPAPRILPTSNPRYNPSQESGVLIVQSSGNTVGAVGAGNLISGNRYGVNIASLDANAPASSRNVVQGNTIGTDVTGLRALPNFQFGVFITAASDNLINSNLISANGLAGIEIFGGRSQLGGSGTAIALGNTITANQIGVDASGRVAFAVSDGSQIIGSIAQHPEITLPDGNVVNYGLQSHGVVVIGSSGNRVGLPGEGNVISGNILTGVYISRRDDQLNLFALPVDNAVQSNNLNVNGIYGVFRYDAPNGNPVAESPASNANTFTGTPIPIGDFVTGIDVSTPQTRAQSILLGPAGGAPRGPRRTPRRPRGLNTATPGSTLAASRPALARPALSQLAQAIRPR
ncbi:beta strand repeat-containing protein [Paludisphaera soli]|uniref:beta strand repeat-containing protein n=1 Tax=Paludisphaera soli TaxID=2712865 RepID=UPI0013ED7A23|nr:right-handed parallel beta-helix repeat-containing protein [Paludisphaera soli]